MSPRRDGDADQYPWRRKGLRALGWLYVAAMMASAARLLWCSVSSCASLRSVFVIFGVSLFLIPMTALATVWARRDLDRRTKWRKTHEFTVGLAALADAAQYLVSGGVVHAERRSND